MKFYDQRDLVNWMQETTTIHKNIERLKRLIATKPKDLVKLQRDLADANYELYSFRTKFNSIPLAVMLVGRFLYEKATNHMYEIKKFSPVLGKL